MREFVLSYIRIAIKQLKKFWLVILIVIGVLITLNLLFPDVGCCGVKLLVGIPCPTCGMTRAFHALIKLDISRAFFYHPLFWMLPIIGWIVLFNERPIPGKLFHSLFFWLFICLVFLIVYAIRFSYIFPNAPFEFNPYSLRSIVERFIRKLFNT